MICFKKSIAVILLPFFSVPLFSQTDFIDSLKKSLNAKTTIEDKIAVWTTISNESNSY